MTFTKELPTVPGFYAWRISSNVDPEVHKLVIVDGVLKVMHNAPNGLCELHWLQHGEWCRLVPAKELNKAWIEGADYGIASQKNWERGIPHQKFRDAWNDSRAKWVMEGKE